MLVVLLALNFIQISQSKIDFPQNSINAQVKCLFDLHLSSFEVNYVVMYFPNTKQKTEEFLHLARKLNGTVQIINFNGNEDQFSKVPHKFLTHILLISSVEEFQYFLRKMYGTAIWNAGGKYIAAYFGKEDDKDFLTIFQSSWMQYIININLIPPTLEILTYFPYSPSSNCGRTITPTSLGNCNTHPHPLPHQFPSKIPSNMRQCPIRAMMNWYPPFVLDPSDKTEKAGVAGFDLAILNSFVRRYNLSSRTVALPGAFAHFTDGKYGGSLKYIAENLSDIAFGTLYPNVSFFIDVDVSLLYHYVHFNWVVPKAILGEQWKNMVLIFDPVLWTVILVVLSCSMVIWCIFERFTDRNKFSKTVLNCWYSFLQGSIALPQSSPMRLLVIFWVFFTLLLATLYQSQLLSILLTPVYQHQISNAKELVNSKVTTYVPNSFYVRLNNSARTVDKEIFAKTVLVTYDDLAVITSRYSDNAGFLGNQLTTLYFMPRNYSSKTGKPMMYMCRDEEFGNPITMYFRKGFPLIGVYNRWLQYMLDAGLVSKWLKDATYFAPRIRDENGPKKFSLDQLSGAFFVLCLGLGGSALIFIIELFYYNCLKTSK